MAIIPGINAKGIMSKVKLGVWNNQIKTKEEGIENYIKRLEELLLLAIKDALINADVKGVAEGDYSLHGSEAECRAIAFLNQMIPYNKI